jgi:hypothetical protein
MLSHNELRKADRWAHIPHYSLTYDRIQTEGAPRRGKPSRRVSEPMRDK